MDNCTRIKSYEENRYGNTGKQIEKQKFCQSQSWNTLIGISGKKDLQSWKYHGLKIPPFLITNDQIYRNYNKLAIASFYENKTKILTIY